MKRYIKVGNETDYRDTYSHSDEGITYELDDEGIVWSYWIEGDVFELGKLVDETDEKPENCW